VSKGADKKKIGTTMGLREGEHWGCSSQDARGTVRTLTALGKGEMVEKRRPAGAGRENELFDKGETPS